MRSLSAILMKHFSFLTLVPVLLGLCQIASAQNSIVVDGRVGFAIDEWNNRHDVNTGGSFRLIRGDDRRQYDVPTTASVLNVFIRNSPGVVMANYIFPVNGHGLVKTIDDNHAYKSLTYNVFDLYHRYMEGHALPVSVNGPGIKHASLKDYTSLSGDMDSSTLDLAQDLCYIDAACAVDEDGIINIALVNRSYDRTQTVNIEMPDGYQVFEAWSLESDKVTDFNTQSVQNGFERKAVNEKGTRIKLSPCGLVIVRCSLICPQSL